MGFDSREGWIQYFDLKVWPGVLLGLTLGVIAVLRDGDLAMASRRQVKLAQRLVGLIEESRVSVPQNHEVCFSPDERCDLKLIKFVESAKASLDIAVFDLNLEQLVHEILKQAKQGIHVRVLVDSRQAKGAYSLVSTLVKGGVEVRTGRQRGLMHHKFAVVDSKRLETGSFNFTHHASNSNQENQIYLDDPAVVTRFVAQFEKVWERAKNYRY